MLVTKPLLEGLLGSGAVGVRDCYSPLIKGKRRGTGESLKYIRVMKIGEGRGLEK